MKAKRGIKSLGYLALALLITSRLRAELAAPPASESSEPSTSVRSFGAHGDGVHDDATAVQDALTKNSTRSVFLPRGDYLIQSRITVPANTTLRGEGSNSSRLLLGYDGDMMELGENAQLQFVGLFGNAAKFKNARGLVINGRNGRQKVFGCSIVDFDGCCIEFTSETAGSSSTFIDSKIERAGAFNATAPDRYSVKISGAARMLKAAPRLFSGIETEGTQLIDLGPSNIVFISNSFVGGIGFGPESRGAIINGCRLANMKTLTVAGFNHVITGCDISPTIVLAPGTGEVAIRGNTYNQREPIIDNSGNGGRNQIDTPTVQFTPTLSSGGTIGNGALRGAYSRSGAQVQLSVEMRVGDATKFDHGAIEFANPIPPVTRAAEAHVGQGYCERSADNSIVPVVAIAKSGTKTISVQLPGSHRQMSGDQPWRWSTGDILRFSLSYSL